MKQGDIIKIAGAAVVAAILSLIISTAIFNSPAKHDQTTPVVQTISTTFPDITNDPTYQGIFYPGALDPTQPVQVGNSSGTQPFTSTGQ